MSIVELLEKLAQGQGLTVEEMTSAWELAFANECSDAQIAAILTALRVRGETVDELVGTALALRRALPPIDCAIEGLLDTCGSGGDGVCTFNISTAAAIVAAACGVPVAKHGNRSVSSSSGSADVLGILGINIEAPAATVLGCLRECGLAFFFAPMWHPTMKRVMPVRRELKFRTIFNLVGPLCNPARAPLQLLGVGRIDLADKLAAALLRLGAKSAIVVTGADGLDEVTLADQTRAICIRDGEMMIETWTPDSFGLRECSLGQLRVQSPKESAEVIQSVLEGCEGPHRDIVLANTAAALRAAGKVSDLIEGVHLAGEAIDSGAARQRLTQWVRLTCS